jgi:hypothetical protein
MTTPARYRSPRQSSHSLALDVLPAEEIARRAARRAALIRVKRMTAESERRLFAALRVTP